MPSAASLKRILSWLWTHRDYVAAFGTPVALLFLPLVWQTPAARCAYILVWMAVYWIVEVYPLAITALMPLVLFPMLGIMSASEVAQSYIKDTQILFKGGLTVAVAVEHCNLHKRLALGVLMLVGSQVQWLMLGFMAVTFFVAMWICNMVTTTLMVPVVMAVLKELMAQDSNNTIVDAHSAIAHSNHSLAQVKSTQQIALGVTPAGEKVSTESLVEDTSLDSKPVTSCNGTEAKMLNGSIRDGDIIELLEKADSLALVSSGETTIERDAPSPQDFVVTPGFTQGIENNTLCKAMLLCICYSANIGGTATLYGTFPNLILAGQVETIYGVEISFTGWLVFALPNALICIIIAWLWLQFYFFGFKKLCGCCRDDNGTVGNAPSKAIREQYNALGPFKFSEGVVLANFILLILLFLTRSPSFTSGWGDIFESDYVTDGTAAILIVLVLFLCPAERPGFLCRDNASDDTKSKMLTKRLIGWNTVHEKLPWCVFFLLGGGFALAAGVQKSGLSKEISSILCSLEPVPPFFIVLILCAVVATLTEFASNPAVATIMIPILADLSTALQVHPYYLLYPGVIAASFAFMLPVATPPNAVVFSYGTLRISDMAKAGLVMNIACCLIVTVTASTYGYFVFDWNTFPDWAELNDTEQICT